MADAAPASKCWTDTPAARALLDEAIAADLRPVFRRQHYAITMDEWRVYEGPIADQLEAIREQHLCALSGADWSRDVSDEHGNRYFELHETQPSVAAAIDAAFEAISLAPVTRISAERIAA